MHQFGFRANLGTENAIFRLISEILHSLNQKTIVSGIFCDLEKAFDCVSREVLLNKLKFYGIIDIQYNLYRSYLQDRFQRTAIKNGLNNKCYLNGLKWLMEFLRAPCWDHCCSLYIYK
jgi:hypothetical protein